MRVARFRDLVAAGYPLSAVARAAGISRQALYRVPRPRTAPQRRPVSDPVEQAIVEEAAANQTDGYRMVTAFVRRRLGRPVNGKRVLRVMRQHRLIQRRRPLERRKRPGFFKVERPRQLWQLDMSSVWVAEHGWTYLMAIIDCCTREIVAWQLELRCRAIEAEQLIVRAAAVHGIQPGELVLGSDNGSAFTARRFRQALSGLGIRHRRGGYRNPESQAFIESWFGKLKEREVSLNEYQTLDQARQGIGGYVDRYHHRPHSGLGYQTPNEVRRTWEDQQELLKTRGLTRQHRRGAGQFGVGSTVNADHAADRTGRRRCGANNGGHPNSPGSQQPLISIVCDWKAAIQEETLAKKTIRVSDISGAEIPDGKGATIRITFADARKGVRELDVTDAEAEKLGGRSVARRGRRPRAAPASP